MNNIVITWTSSWIWKSLWEFLKNENNIIWVSRSENNIIWIEYIKWDLNNLEFIEELSKKIEKIDYLILNAWVGYFDNFEKISLKEHLLTINLNLTSNIALVYSLLNKIKKWIIFIWSLSWKKSQKYWSVYSASKFWIRWFAMNLKNELSWIKIHIINPKIVKTNFHNNSKIEIIWKYSETSLQEINSCVNDIINWKEKKFEIDL